MRKLLLIGGAIAVVLGLVVAGVLIRERLTRTPLEKATSALPAGSLRVAFTDWKSVRERLKVRADENISEWVERGYDRDLTAASSIDEAAAAMDKIFGFSPANADWEAFAQGREGATMVLGLADDVDFGGLRKNLAEAGFTKPTSPEATWQGGVDLVAQLDPTLTPEVQYVVLLEDRGLVVTSDSREYAAQTAKVISGDAKSLSDKAATRELVAHLDTPDAAILWAGDFACEDLSMSRAGDEEQQEASRLISEAGEISPFVGWALTLTGDRIRAAGQFPDSDQAKTNLRSRSKLAVGPAVGRSEGSFADQVALREARTDGSTMLLDFRARDAAQFPFSRLYDGPLIFASC